MKREVSIESPLTELRGVGVERAGQLARIGLERVKDLLFTRPRRYEDRRHFRPIGETTIGEAALVQAKVVTLGLKRYAKGYKSVFELILEDGSGRLHCRWWNLPYMQNYFRQGDEVLIYGKLNCLKPRTIDHPETEVIEEEEENSIHLGRVVPIYPLTEGLPQRWLRSLVWRTLPEFEEQVADSYPEPPEPGLPSTRQALRWLHFPADIEHAEQARRRLAFNEFVRFQLQLTTRRRRLYANAVAAPCAGTNAFIKPFLAGLGFQLTGAQKRVLGELRQDMASGKPMRRLLQGDVGSGKTVVAVCAALMALESGYNVALMVPTELLADQHSRTLKRWLEPLKIAVTVRTGSQKSASEEAPASSEIEFAFLPQVKGDAEGPRRPRVVIGTHALIAERFEINNLGLVIIDEQHKFGVAQREQLVRKGKYPHLLVMTATPIPRTLALTLYGDLEVSVIDELPPARGAIQTFVRSREKLLKVWDFVRQQVAEGRQAYVVYPRVEDTGGGDLKAVTKELEHLEKILHPLRVRLLHGRLPSHERERTMQEFQRNLVNVVVATSVIEVGVDVPNATVMIIENADRFGLAQLHQLRGRIGRGSHKSYCILVADPKTEPARQRLQVLVDTTDGFRVAEADLQLRGAGELLGQEQSGETGFIFGNLSTDLNLVQQARQYAAMLLEQGNLKKE